jgi:citrate synthase
MKVVPFNAGSILKEISKEIKAAAKAANLNAGDLNNALIQKAPKTVEDARKLLIDAPQLVADYQNKQTLKQQREKTPVQKIIATLVSGTKANPSKLSQAAVAGNVNKTELNAALLHFLAKPENQNPEAAEAALAKPDLLVEALRIAQKQAQTRKNTPEIT